MGRGEVVSCMFCVPCDVRVCCRCSAFGVCANLCVVGRVCFAHGCHMTSYCARPQKLTPKKAKLDEFCHISPQTPSDALQLWEQVRVMVTMMTSPWVP